ncbi:NACHT domain-containing protein [Bacillus thuringiensis]|nr:NACHT domain-containing protein [Bacillus thuringiensis]MED2922825.1 NACHT domain-containing protein [Bacillus thuringiensis]MED3051183.1 NACHT domain-containing protein [Bacillus thuringiensis]
MSTTQQSDVIPSWLETPSKTIIDPPVDTKIQELPFDELEWEDFERLCLRLVRLEGNVEHCQLYGTRGQAQEGIDLYARRANEKYFVYQCKRVKNFGPAAIKAAVKKFLEGKWANKTDTFILCTSESMVPTECADEIEAQREVLNKEGIKFISWDKVTLSSKLKDLPKIVDDFFGRSWVDRFCGSEKAQGLGSRLDNKLVSEFREKMKVFYKQVFQTHDPGLPTATNMNMSSITLEDRFVLPDISDRRTINLSNNVYDTKQKYNEVSLSNKPQHKEDRNITTGLNTTYQQRQDFESWLSNNNGRNIIIGGPGSGKSTLLRYIAIDLLSKSPKLSNLSKKWGLYLPVWIPFALWTKYISESQTGTCSIKDVLMGWLKSWDEERLWPLVERALNDERLILLVDGLDEWTNEHSARIALNRLTVFVQQRNIPVILTSRPHGFERMGLGSKGWEIGELSDFSTSQQKELLDIWFTLWHQNNIGAQEVKVDEVRQRTKHTIDGFMSELQKSSDLRELAKVPLLLSLLILLKINDARLPQNRFKAYDKLIELLISTHPQRRIAAAGIQMNQIDLTDDEIKMVMSFLAFIIHEKHNEGIISTSEATLQLEEYLKDEELGLGLEKRDALKISKAIINIGEGNLGLLVSKSPTEVGFFHRAFQEFLASYFLYTSNRKNQLQLIESNCTNSQWHEVILGLFYINNRPEDIRDYTKIIKDKMVTESESFSKKLLLYEAAFGQYNMPTSLAKKYCEEAFDEIETNHWMPYREKVLRIVIDGLRSSRLKEIIKQKIIEWFPNRRRWREDFINAISNWEDKDNHLLTYLIRGLFDEEFYNKRAAINVITIKYSDIPELGNYLVSVVKGPRDPITKALVVEGLIKGWPGHHEIDSIIKYAGKSVSPELRLSSVKGKIERNIHRNEDLNTLLELGDKNSRLSYYFRDDIANLLLKGWPGNAEVLSACLTSVKTEFSNQVVLDTSTALKVLLSGYSQEEEVLNYFVMKIKEESRPFPFHRVDVWRIIKEKYQGNKLIINAIDSWLQKDPSDDISIAYASLVGCSDIAKNILLERVQSSSFSHWSAEALLEGWGMQDNQVASTLTKIVNGPSSNASKIGYLIPKIIPDKDSARGKLMELIRSQSNFRLDFLLNGLEDVWDISIENDIKEYILNIATNPDKNSSPIINNRVIAINFLARKFIKDPRVKELAKQEISKRNGFFDIPAKHYGNDPLIRESLLKVGFPLPVQLRQIIAKRLSGGMDQDEFNTPLLELYDYEIDPLVKTQSSIGFHKQIKFSENKISKAVEILSKSIVCSGMDFEGRRQAAFCGLATLNKIEVFLNAKEKLEPAKASRVPLTAEKSPNIPFVKSILENWEYIKSYIGEDISIRFNEYGEDALQFYEKISLIISDDYPGPKRDIINFLENRTERTITPNLLKLLSKERPNSSILLEYLFEVLKPEYDFEQTDELIYITSRILSKQFKDDMLVLKTIRDFALEPELNEAAIVALCEGWPRDEGIFKILKYVRENRFSLRYMTYFELVSRTKSTDAFFEIVMDEINNNKDKLLQWNKEEVNGPILRRIREDEALYVRLLYKLSNESTTVEKANISKIIAASRGVSPELREWITEQLSTEWDDIFHQDVEDLLLGEIRPMVHLLLEI